MPENMEACAMQFKAFVVKKGTALELTFLLQAKF